MIAINCIAISMLMILSPQHSVVTTRFIQAVAIVESNNDSKAVGDGGKSIGMFQFTKDAWDETSELIRDKISSRYFKPVSYSFATNSSISVLYAIHRFKWFEQKLIQDGVMPNNQRLYACWNLGYNGFKKRGFSISKCPAVTKEAIRKLKKAMNSKP